MPAPSSSKQALTGVELGRRLSLSFYGEETIRSQKQVILDSYAFQPIRVPEKYIKHENRSFKASLKAVKASSVINRTALTARASTAGAKPTPVAHLRLPQKDEIYVMQVSTVASHRYMDTCPSPPKKKSKLALHQGSRPPSRPASKSKANPEALQSARSSPFKTKKSRRQ